MAEEKLKRAKLNKYSKVKSKVGSTQWTPNKDMKAKEEGLTLKTMSKNMNSPSNRRELPQRWDLGQEFLESSTNVNAGGNIQDISMIQHVYDEKSPLGQTDNGKINLEIPAKISSKGGISAHQVTPNAENNHLPMNNFVSQSSPIPVKAAFKPKSSTNVNAEIIMPLSKNLTKAASSSNLVTPKSNSKPLKATSTSNSTPTLNSKIKLGNAKSTADTDRIIQKVLQALETKLDPMLAKVQQHWENAAANIDEKIAHALERHEEVVQEPLLVDMEEPSILVESETQYFQVTNAKAISPKQFQQDGGGHDEDDAILIQNEIKYVEKAPKIPYQRTVLALPAYMIEDIIQDQSRKQKWREMYYGADFDSASAIER